tara:strand:- start:143 stop:352 length:210 start_codon:yes stop_codon:yes gene_type:complete
MSILFDEEKWKKNVSQYNLVEKDSGKTLETRYLLHDDAGLLNRIYAQEGRSADWREVNWESKSAKKKRK